MSHVYGRAAEELGASRTDSPLQVEVQGIVGLPQADLFALITDVSRLPTWLPMCRRAEADDREAIVPSQVGSVRLIFTGTPKPARERIVVFEAPRLYAYCASDASLRGMFRDHLGVISVEPRTESDSVLTWLAYGKPHPLRLVRYIGLRAFSFVMRGGLENLRKRYPAPVP